jgi:hypothetical protein
MNLEKESWFHRLRGSGLWLIVACVWFIINGIVCPLMGIKALKASLKSPSSSNVNVSFKPWTKDYWRVR